MNNYVDMVNIGPSEIQEHLNTQGITQTNYCKIVKRNPNTISQANKTGLVSKSVGHEFAEYHKLTLDFLVTDRQSYFNSEDCKALNFIDQSVNAVETILREVDPYYVASLSERNKNQPYAKDLLLLDGKKKILQENAPLIKRVTKHFIADKDNKEEDDKVYATSNIEEQFAQLNLQPDYSEDFDELKKKGIYIYYAAVPFFHCTVLPSSPKASLLITKKEKLKSGDYERKLKNPEILEKKWVQIIYTCLQRQLIVFSTNKNSKYSAKYSLGNLPDIDQLNENDIKENKILIRGMFNKTIDYDDIKKHQKIEYYLKKFNSLTKEYDQTLILGKNKLGKKKSVVPFSRFALTAKINEVKSYMIEREKELKREKFEDYRFDEDYDNKS